MIKNKKSSKKKIIVSAVLGLVLLAGVATALELTNVTDFYRKKSNTPEDTSQNGINYGPPTDEEQQSGDDKKQDIVEEQDEPTPPPENANVVIVDANQYDNEIEVRAFVSNLVKDGTCKITFTKGSLKIEKQAAAYADASTTPCTNLIVPRSEFAEAGNWTVKVEYTASDSYGKAEQSIEIK